LRLAGWCGRIDLKAGMGLSAAGFPAVGEEMREARIRATASENWKKGGNQAEDSPNILRLSLFPLQVFRFFG
jgi:hypothetical protein